MSFAVRNIYYFKSQDSNEYELTDNEDLAKSQDSNYRLAHKLELIEYYTDYGEVFYGFLSTYDGLVLWRQGEEDAESGYELLIEKELLH